MSKNYRDCKAHNGAMAVGDGLNRSEHCHGICKTLLVVKEVPVGASFKNLSFGSVSLVLAASFLVACNNARLEPNLPAGTLQTKTAGEGPEKTPQAPLVPRGRGPVKGDSVTCSPSQIKQGSVVKVLFLVDGSGSNFGANGSLPSDPDKQWRIDTVGRFVDAHIENKNVLYNFTLFKGTTAKSHINPNGEPGFSSDNNEVAEGFRSFMNVADGGNTPYKAALRTARNMIAADLENHAADNATYSVVIVSDGHPTDYKNAHDVIPDASAIKDLAPNRIILNSVYYSAEKINASAPQYLKSIAHIGDGAFIVASTKKRLQLDSLIRISAVSCR